MSDLAEKYWKVVLEQSHKIGALEMEVRLLKRDLDAANEAVAELRAMNERAREDAA